MIEVLPECRSFPEIKAAKKTYELRVANSKDPKIFYKYIRNRFTGPVRNPQLRNENGVIVTDDEIIDNLFTETLAQSCPRETVTNTTPLVFRPKINFVFSDIGFPDELIKIKLSKFKSTTSPGPDGITPTVLKTCAETVCTPLKILMTQSFQNSQFPEDWKLAIVKSIFKKGDKFQSVNYRPISISVVIAKIMESIISDEIRKFMLANNVLFAEQHGFVPKKVKVDASLSDLTAVGSGVPQGSMLGPLLFIRYIPDLKSEIQSRCLFYADDLKTYNDSPTNCSILSKYF
ncbi:uncharacterized protein LOC135136044 [Zophobas morio]|uniref:uncharacterized protein LOC135136044 n=1 Tax=Zophobas morio TaxID=2755281 RepID=UPI0030835910